MSVICFRGSFDKRNSTGRHPPDSPSCSSMMWAIKWSFAWTIPSVKKVTKQPVTPTTTPKAIVSPRPTSFRCLFDPFVPRLLLSAAFCLCVCHTYHSGRAPRPNTGNFNAAGAERVRLTASSNQPRKSRRLHSSTTQCGLGEACWHLCRGMLILERTICNSTTTLRKHATLPCNTTAAVRNPADHSIHHRLLQNVSYISRVLAIL